MKLKPPNYWQCQGQHCPRAEHCERYQVWYYQQQAFAAKTLCDASAGQDYFIAVTEIELKQEDAPCQASA